MKVRVAFSIEVDRDEWAAEYGCGNSAREIQRDVQAHFLNVVQQSAPGLVLNVAVSR